MGPAVRSVTLILPTIDEADNLAVLLPEVLALDEVRQIVVVDDGSTDGTQSLVERIGAHDPRVQLVRRTGRRSLTASLQDGIDRAEHELVGWMDADGTMPVRDLRALVAAIEEGADVAIGSRFIVGGGAKGQIAPGFLGRMRALFTLGETRDGMLGVASSWLLNAVLLPIALARRGTHDWTSGFLLARRAALAPLRLRGDHGEYFLDLWIRAERRGLRVVQVPCRMRPRLRGASKTGRTFTDYLRRGARYLTAARAVRRNHDDAS